MIWTCAFDTIMFKEIVLIKALFLFMYAINEFFRPSEEKEYVKITIKNINIL